MFRFEPNPQGINGMASFQGRIFTPGYPGIALKKAIIFLFVFFLNYFSK